MSPFLHPRSRFRQFLAWLQYLPISQNLAMITARSYFSLAWRLGFRTYVLSRLTQVANSKSSNCGCATRARILLTEIN